jgi:hypothetical protein
MAEIAIEQGAFRRRLKALYESWKVRLGGTHCDRCFRAGGLQLRPLTDLACRATGPRSGRGPTRSVLWWAAPARTYGT